MLRQNGIEIGDEDDLRQVLYLHRYVCLMCPIACIMCACNSLHAERLYIDAVNN